MERPSVLDDLPDFDASLGALTLLLHELLLVGAGGGELVAEGMEVDRQDAVFEAVPADVRGIDVHKMAVLLYSSKSTFGLTSTSTPRQSPTPTKTPAFFLKVEDGLR